jgi:hypothetical protein
LQEQGFHGRKRWVGTVHKITNLFHFV